ncbi:hypothetical protein LguiB_018635 [Lonicera macranthoides]
MREKRLYKASLKGDVQSLTKLMQEDELILEHGVPITCFNETPLHVAAMKGHVDFARAILEEKPDMVTELDSRGRSPLHLASANGHVEMVKLLVTADPNFVLPKTKAISIIHSYVIHNGLEALKHLVEADHNILNYQDEDGNTILHKVTALKQTEVIEYVLSTSTELKINMVNAKGFTASDVIAQMPTYFKTRQVHELLVKAGAKRGELFAMGHEISTPVSVTVPPKPPSIRGPKSQHKIKNIKKMLKRKQDMLLMAATVIATMSYQAGLNPPGGVSDDQKIVMKSNGETVTVQAGTSIMAAHNSSGYERVTSAQKKGIYVGTNRCSVCDNLAHDNHLPCYTTSYYAIASRVPLVMGSGPAWGLPPPLAGSAWDVSDRIVKNSVWPLIGLVGSILLVHMFRLIMWIRKQWKYMKDKRVSREEDEGEGRV